MLDTNTEPCLLKSVIIEDKGNQYELLKWDDKYPKNQPFKLPLYYRHAIIDFPFKIIDYSDLSRYFVAVRTDI